MISKEDILDDVTVMPGVDYIPRKAVLKVMDIYAKEIAIGFAEWMNKIVAQWDWQNNEWILKTSSGLDYKIGYTTEQLFQSFLNTLKQ